MPPYCKVEVRTVPLNDVTIVHREMVLRPKSKTVTLPVSDSEEGKENQSIRLNQSSIKRTSSLKRPTNLLISSPTLSPETQRRVTISEQVTKITFELPEPTPPAFSCSNGFSFATMGPKVTIPEPRKYPTQTSSVSKNDQSKGRKESTKVPWYKG